MIYFPSHLSPLAVVASMVCFRLVESKACSRRFIADTLLAEVGASTDQLTYIMEKNGLPDTAMVTVGTSHGRNTIDIKEQFAIVEAYSE